MDLFPVFKKTLPLFVSPGDRIIVAVSGGPDSTALLDLLNRVKGEYHLKLFAAHFNHILRGRESGRDAEFVKKLAQRYSIPFLYAKKDIKKLAKAEKGGTEKAGRDERYKFFIRSAARTGASKIALAHNRDDNAETVLFRILTGAGAEGLSGIRARRKLDGSEFGVKNGGQITLVRPLSGFLKKDILKYLFSRKLGFRVDRSNLENVYARNKLRNRLIPLIEKELNRGVKDSLSNLSEILGAENDFLESAALKEYKLAVKHVRGGIGADIKGLLKCHRALRLRVIRMMLKSVITHHRKITSGVINAVEECALTGRKYSLPEGFTCSSGQGLLVFSRSPAAGGKAGRVIVKDPYKAGKIPYDGRVLEFKISRVSEVAGLKDKDSAHLDFSKVKLPLIIRGREPGDSFIPYGMEKKVKLKKFINSQKAGRNIILICGRKEILWVAGIRIDDRYKITSNTDKVLNIVLKK